MKLHIQGESGGVGGDNREGRKQDFFALLFFSGRFFEETLIKDENYLIFQRQPWVG